MFKKIVHIGLLVLIAILVIGSLVFSSKRLARVKCSELTIVIPEESTRFIDEEEVARLVNEAAPNLKSTRLSSINTYALEKSLQKNPAIKNAEVYRHISGERMSFKGELVVEVQQRDPLFRVMNENEDYYMDEKGVRIPANPKFSAHVMLVTGKPNIKLAVQQLVPLVKYISEDAFWKAQIKQIDVRDNGELTMVPLVGEQLIEFGDGSNYREKLRNLKALYEQAFPKAGWDKYSKISVKYANQVVCTRKGETALAVAAADTVPAAVDTTAAVAKPVAAPPAKALAKATPASAKKTSAKTTAKAKPKVSAKTQAKAKPKAKTKAATPRQK